MIPSIKTLTNDDLHDQGKSFIKTFYGWVIQVGKIVHVSISFYLIGGLDGPIWCIKGSLPTMNPIYFTNDYGCRMLPFCITKDNSNGTNEYRSGIGYIQESKDKTGVTVYLNTTATNMKFAGQATYITI